MSYCSPTLDPRLKLPSGDSGTVPRLILTIPSLISQWMEVTPYWGGRGGLRPRLVIQYIEKHELYLFIKAC